MVERENGAAREVESDPGEDADQREQHVKSDCKGCDESAAAKEPLHLVGKRGKRVKPMLWLGAAASVRQPSSNRSRAGESRGSECEKAHAPAEPVRQNAGGYAADETAESGAADVEAHDERNVVGRPLLADVGHHHGDYAGHDDALQESPEDELCKRCRCSGEQRGQRDAQQRSHDDALARQPLGERAEDGCGEGDSQRGRRNRHAHAGLRGVKEPRQQGKQRLRAVELKKGADTAKRHGGCRSPSGRVTLLRGCCQASAYRMQSRSWAAH